MKITKKIEAEIKVLMEDYFDSYLKGNLKRWASYLVDDYQNIGTTEAEIWKSKKEVYDYSKSVLDQMVGLTELRNKKTEIIPYDPYVMVHEYLDIYIKAEKEWIFYSKLRLSSLIQKIDNNWKILHQHGSYPDSKVTDGEFFAFDTLKSENLKLQKAIKKRTLELEKTNRELEIEAALERVRTVAMGMKKSEDLLRICEVSFRELQKLGFDNLRNAVIHILNDEQKYFMDYDFSDFTGGQIGKIEYGLHPIVDEYLKKIKSAEDAFFEVVIADDMLEDWNEFRRKSGQMNDQRLDKAEALYYYLFSIGIGDIGISTFKPINESQIKILKRFRNVFDLAYRRYNDITLAEAQAREAQIEAALERVRAKSMAMHKSDELADLSFELVKQVQALGISTWFCAFNIYDDDPKGSLEWGSNAEGTYEEYRTPREGIFLRYYEAGQRGETLLINEIDENECPGHYEYLCSLPGVGEQLLQIKDAGIPFPTSQIDHVAFFKYGYIIFITFEPAHEAHDIFKRFAKVFEQTYTRFLDLQKAEAQAREAQIEAALERVRARAMGMHKSEEVSDVSDLLFSELNKLSLDIRGCSIVVIDEDKDKMELWRARSNVAVKPVEITSLKKAMNLLKQNMPDWLPIFSKALSKRKNYLHDELSGERRIQFINTIVEQYNYSEAEKIQLLKNAPEKINTHYIFFKLGYLALLAENKLSDENLAIARRFVEVFEFSYTRFLDIKKAEEQAREAQIEAALEKVRSRSLAMHTTKELGDVVSVIVEKLKDLGVVLDANGIVLCTYFDDSKDVLHWIVSPDFSFTGSYRLPYFEHPIFITAWESKLNGDEYFSKAYTIEEKNSFFEYAFEHSDYKHFPNEFKQWIFKNDKHILSFAWQKNSAILIPSHTGVVPSEDEVAILKRFAKVFEQSYVRFLDLKKAEAQAREAEIEAAIERVRANAMAMHKSEDLTSSVAIVFSELEKLGFNTVRCGIGIFNDKSKKVNVWTASNAEVYLSGDEVLEGHPLLNGIYDAWQKQVDFSYILEGEDLLDYYKVVAKSNLPVAGPKVNSEKVTQYFHLVIFSAGGLFAFRESGFSDEAKQLMKRFGDVFSLAFTRHLDLKKAEAQAREAQIELSLERIRAQVTAMKESSDLLDIVVTMRTEFVSLGHEAHYFWHMRYLPEKYEKAMTSGDGARIGMVMTLPRHIHGDIKLLADWEKSDKTTVVFAMGVETAIDYIDKMITLGDFQQVDPNSPTLDDIRHIGGLTFVMARTTHGEIGYSLPGVVPDPPVEDLAILVRFAGVFDLAYKRFEDLKSSEQRNREAQIELALERVRARTMAMQKANELAQTAAHLFKQLNELGIKPYRCNIAIVNKELKNCNIWSTTNSGNVIPTGSAIPLSKYPVLIEMFKGWKTQRTNHKIKLEGIKRLEWTKYISKYLPFEEYKQKNIDESEILNNAAYFSNLYFKQGFFTIHSKEELTEDQLKIIQRFAYVFEQTYTRFQDLENSEKQNKIIQAENERKTEELEEARQLQLSMLPKELPKLPNMDIAVYMQTATEVGGDYYDFNVDSNGILTTVIGDATGHGMKAGTIVTITKSLFNSLASEKNILKVFTQISQVIRDMKFRQLSMCLMMIKIIGNKLLLSSAAMPPAYIYRKRNKNVEEILINGMPLGALHNFPYKIRETSISSGDVILLMSDGYPELMNDKGHMFGYEKALRLFEELAHKQAEEIIEGLKNSASKWVQDKMPDDDVTFVVIKVK